VSGYRREQKARTQWINRLHGTFVHAGITTVVKKDLKTDEARRDAVKQLGGTERREADHLVKCLELHEDRIAALKRKMAERANEDKQIEQLETVPGVGLMTAFAFRAFVNVKRFENGAQAANYLGLTPRVYMSGSLIRDGWITKRGNGYLRALLVQGSWALVRSKDGGALKERFEYMTKEKGIGKKKTIVAVTRRLGALQKNGTVYEAKRFRPGKPAGVNVLVQEALSA
jgi:transposase